MTVLQEIVDDFPKIPDDRRDTSKSTNVFWLSRYIGTEKEHQKHPSFNILCKELRFEKNELQRVDL